VTTERHIFIFLSHLKTLFIDADRNLVSYLCVLVAPPAPFSPWPRPLPLPRPLFEGAGFIPDSKFVLIFLLFVLYCIPCSFHLSYFLFPISLFPPPISIPIRCDFIPHWLSLYNLFIQATTRIYCDSPLIPFDSITRLKFAPPAAFLWVYRESWKSGKSRKTDGSGSKGETLKSRTHIEWGPKWFVNEWFVLAERFWGLRPVDKLLRAGFCQLAKFRF